MAGISDKALKTNYAQNKYRYNGKELQNQEFSDGTGLEEYDYGARFQDPQLGRFFTQDRFSEKYHSLSPYQYSDNNPIRNIDVNGDSIIIGSINISNPVDAPRGGNIGKISLTTIDIEGKLINESTTSYSDADMQTSANRLNDANSSYFSVTGVSVAISDISVASADNPLQSGDHAYRIEDPGLLPGSNGDPGVVGMTPIGQNVVNLNSLILSQTPATTGEYAGTGKSASGGATLERTGAHETGHSAGLDHPAQGTASGNLMNQTIRPDAGKNITPDQIKQISNAFKKGKLNQGAQN